MGFEPHYATEAEREFMSRLEPHFAHSKVDKATASKPTGNAYNDKYEYADRYMRARSSRIWSAMESELDKSDLDAQQKCSVALQTIIKMGTTFEPDSEAATIYKDLSNDWKRPFSKDFLRRDSFANGLSARLCDSAWLNALAYSDEHQHLTKGETDGRTLSNRLGYWVHERLLLRRIESLVSIPDSLVPETLRPSLTSDHHVNYLLEPAHHDILEWSKHKPDSTVWEALRQVSVVEFAKLKEEIAEMNARSSTVEAIPELSKDSYSEVDPLCYVNPDELTVCTVQ